MRFNHGEEKDPEAQPENRALSQGEGGQEVKYFMQPNGKWKKGGDGRSTGKTLAEVKAMGGKIEGKRK